MSIDHSSPSVDFYGRSIIHRTIRSVTDRVTVLEFSLPPVSESDNGSFFTSFKW